MYFKDTLMSWCHANKNIFRKTHINLTKEYQLSLNKITFYQLNIEIEPFSDKCDKRCPKC